PSPSSRCSLSLHDAFPILPTICRSGPGCSGRAFPTIWCCRRGGPPLSFLFWCRRVSTPTSFQPKGWAIRDRLLRTTRRKAGHRIDESKSPFRVRAPDGRLGERERGGTRQLAQPRPALPPRLGQLAPEGRRTPKG